MRGKMSKETLWNLPYGLMCLPVTEEDGNQTISQGKHGLMCLSVTGEDSNQLMPRRSVILGVPTSLLILPVWPTPSPNSHPTFIHAPNIDEEPNY